MNELDEKDIKFLMFFYLNKYRLTDEQFNEILQNNHDKDLVVKVCRLDAVREESKGNSKEVVILDGIRFAFEHQDYSKYQAAVQPFVDKEKAEQDEIDEEFKEMENEEIEACVKFCHADAVKACYEYYKAEIAYREHFGKPSCYSSNDFMI